MMNTIDNKYGIVTFNKDSWKEGYKILKAYKKFRLIDNLKKSVFKTSNGKQYNLMYTASEEISNRIRNEFRMSF